MQISDPLVSIVLPVWNGEKYVAEAIESILNQTCTEYELIIINDCSTDNSLEVIEKYSSKDSRIKIINNQTNKKLPASLNIGFAAAKGKYFTWTSDDNVLSPNFLEEMISQIELTLSDFIYANYFLIDESGAMLKEVNVPHIDQIILKNVIGPSFLYKKEVHISNNGYNENYFMFEDYDFWVRTYEKGFKINKLSKCIYQYRTHANSLSATRKFPENFVRYKYDLISKYSKKLKILNLEWESYISLVPYIKSLGILKVFMLVCRMLIHSPVRSMKLIFQIFRKQNLQ